ACRPGAGGAAVPGLRAAERRLAGAAPPHHRSGARPGPDPAPECLAPADVIGEAPPRSGPAADALTAPPGGESGRRAGPGRAPPPPPAPKVAPTAARGPAVSPNGAVAPRSGRPGGDPAPPRAGSRLGHRAARGRATKRTQRHSGRSGGDVRVSRAADE